MPAMTPEQRTLLEAFAPGAEHLYFEPMVIGDTAASADEGAELILAGVKTATSSAPWDYEAGIIPFPGALSVLLDGRGQSRALIETTTISHIAFLQIDADFALAYGEGDRTLVWWRTVIGGWYRERARRRGCAFADDTLLICEWFRVVRRL